MATKVDYKMQDMGEAKFERIELNGVQYDVGKHDAMFPTGERIQGLNYHATVKILQDAGLELLAYNVADAILTDEIYRKSELRRSFLNKPIWLGANVANAGKYSLLLERPYVKGADDEVQLAGFRKATLIRQLKTGFIVSKDHVTRYPTETNNTDISGNRNKLWATKENGVFPVVRVLWGNGDDAVGAGFRLLVSDHNRGARPMKIVGKRQMNL